MCSGKKRKEKESQVLTSALVLHNLHPWFPTFLPSSNPLPNYSQKILDLYQLCQFTRSKFFNVVFGVHQENIEGLNA